MEALSKLGINLGYLLQQILAFAILLTMLKMWAYEPIVELLAKRRETLSKALEDARIAAEARANAEAEAQRILAEARAKAEEIIREARAKAEEQAKMIIEAAKKEAEKIRQEELAKIEAERNRILAELRDQIAAMAIAAARKIIQDALDEQRQHQLLKEFFAGVKDKQIVVLEDVPATSVDRIEVITAVPLTEEEKAEWISFFKEKVGDVPVEFKVDPSIVGGVVVRIGDRVIDASVRRQLAELQAQLL
ncbi:MAG: F0F1 ATP synthase subunit B [Chloroflexi bacterium]|nr:F0F1 ATP synthase subunit B [Chloroflexota bacterium]